MLDRYTKYATIVTVDYSTKKIMFHHYGQESRVYKWTSRKSVAIGRRCMELWRQGRAVPDFTRGTCFGIDPVPEVTNE